MHNSGHVWLLIDYIVNPISMATKNCIGYFALNITFGHFIWILHWAPYIPLLDLCEVPDCKRVNTGHLKRDQTVFNTLRPTQNGRYFADDTFKPIFLNKNIRIAIKISLKFVPKGRINNIPSLVQIMALRRPGDKPLSEPMMVNLPTHICVTRPQ